MNQVELKTIVRDQILAVAPDADDQTLEDNIAIRDQIDFDSLDHLNFMIGLHKQLGIEIPELDYPKLVSINGCVQYLSDKLRLDTT